MKLGVLLVSCTGVRARLDTDLDDAPLLQTKAAVAQKTKLDQGPDAQSEKGLLQNGQDVPRFDLLQDVLAEAKADSVPHFSIKKMCDEMSNQFIDCLRRYTACQCWTEICQDETENTKICTKEVSDYMFQSLGEADNAHLKTMLEALGTLPNPGTVARDWLPDDVPETCPFIGFAGVAMEIWGRDMTDSEECAHSEAYSEYYGRDYRGCQTKTISGLTCLRWDDPSNPVTTRTYPQGMEAMRDQVPHVGDSEWAQKGLGAHNYCRNPTDAGGHLGSIGCFTTGSPTHWEFCEPRTEAPRPITQYVYHISDGNIPRENKGTVSLVPNVNYRVEFSILQNNLADVTHMVTGVQVGDGQQMVQMGGCNPPGGTFDCTFFKCPFRSTVINSGETGQVDLNIKMVGHSSACQCQVHQQLEDGSWVSPMETGDPLVCRPKQSYPPGGWSIMTMVGKFHFEPLLDSATGCLGWARSLSDDTRGHNLEYKKSGFYFLPVYKEVQHEQCINRLEKHLTPWLRLYYCRVTCCEAEAMPGRWVKGNDGEHCGAVCSNIGMSCDSAAQSALTTNDKVAAAFKEAGYTCKSFHGARSYAGAPFSTGRDGDDCAPFVPGSASIYEDQSSCLENKYSNSAALCYCKALDKGNCLNRCHHELERDQMKQTRDSLSLVSISETHDLLMSRSMGKATEQELLDDLDISNDDDEPSCPFADLENKTIQDCLNNEPTCPVDDWPPVPELELLEPSFLETTTSGKDCKKLSKRCARHQR